jgi:hypothetical protein
VVKFKGALQGITAGNGSKRYRVLQTQAADRSSQWLRRSLVASTGISKTTVQRWLQAFSAQPHRQMHQRCAEG